MKRAITCFGRGIRFLAFLLVLGATTTGFCQAQQEQEDLDTVVVQLYELDSVTASQLYFVGLYWLYPERSNTIRLIRDSADIALIRSNSNYSPVIDALLTDHYFMTWTASVGYGYGESWFEYYVKMITSQSKTIFHCDAIQECDFESDGTIMCDEGCLKSTVFILIKKEYILNTIESTHKDKKVPRKSNK